MPDYPSPCLSCSVTNQDLCNGKACDRWLRRYHYRQKQINAWAKKYCGHVAVKNTHWVYMHPDEYRRYQTYVRNYGAGKIYKIACGPGTNPEAPNYEWTKVLMERAGNHMDGLSLHYYTTRNAMIEDFGDRAKGAFDFQQQNRRTPPQRKPDKER